MWIRVLTRVWIRCRYRCGDGVDTGTTPVELVADGGFDSGTGWGGNALNIVDGVSRADVGAAGNPGCESQW